MPILPEEMQWTSSVIIKICVQAKFTTVSCHSHCKRTHFVICSQSFVYMNNINQYNRHNFIQCVVRYPERNSFQVITSIGVIQQSSFVFPHLYSNNNKPQSQLEYKIIKTNLITIQGHNSDTYISISITCIQIKQHQDNQHQDQHSQ